MKLLRIALISAPLFAIACGGAPRAQPEAPESAASDADEKASDGEGSEEKTDEDAAETKPESWLASLEPGHFFVHRFEGSFSEKPMVLTERVLSRTGDEVEIDYQLESNDGLEHVRVHMNVKSGEVSKVLRVSGDDETEVGIGAYESLLAKTVFAADSNDDLLGYEKSTCLVGEREMDCVKVRYQVSVDDQRATFTVTQSQRLPGRHLGGEIVADDGKVIYRAKLIEMGRDKPSTGVASRD